ncbi:hypothetical protein ACI2JA_01620 [Alkalihalobacillus sp. NPDC078783]
MDLLNILRSYENELIVVDNEYEKIGTYEKKNKLLRRILISFIIVPFAHGLIWTILTSILPMTLLLDLFGLLSFVLPFIVFGIMTSQARERKRKISNSLQIIQQQHDKVLTFGVVPEFYHVKSTITEFIHYLESLQAKTLEECIALKRQYDMHNEQMYMQREQMNTMNALHNRMNDLERTASRSNADLDGVREEIRRNNY